MLSGLLKYLLEGIAVGVSTYLVSKNKLVLNEIIMISLTAAATFALLDMLAPSVSSGARQGAGFGLGARHVGFGAEGFQDEKSADNVQNSMMDSIANLESNLNELREQVMQIPNNTPEVDNIPETIDVEEEDPALSENSEMENIPEDLEEDAVEGFVGFNSKIHESRIITENFQDTAGGEEESTAEEDDGEAAVAGDETATATSTLDLTASNESPHLTRISGVVYSGDLIKIMDEDRKRIFQRSISSSEALMKEPIPGGVMTNISKLRLVKVGADGHSLLKQVPIKYGDTVQIMHSVNDNSKNVDRYVKIGYVLQTHQVGPLFREFTIYKPGDKNNTDYVKYGAANPVTFQNHKYGSFDRGYLSIRADGTVDNSQKELGDATSFVLELNRVYELGNKNLCVCPGDNLYP